jgi:hypothetical protein
VSALEQLLKHGDLLRAQHRAGIVPPAGAVETLFDLMADVRGELATGHVTCAPVTVGSGTPPTATLVVEFKDALGQVVHRVPLQQGSVR